MQNENNIQRYDADGFDSVTAALRELVNSFPGLAASDEISFSALSQDGGKTFVPISGAAVETEKRTITGMVIQTCLYPFYIYYRAKGLSENRKANAKEWLDNLGRWLERQTVTIDGTAYRLTAYPELSNGRKFLSIERQTPAYMENADNDQTEDWAIYITARYENKFLNNGIFAE